MRKNERGITMVSLVITMVVLGIITGITIFTGMGIIKQVELQTINTNMMLIQAKVKTIAEQAKFNKDTNNYLGDLVSEISGNDDIDELIEVGVIEDSSKCYLISQSDLNNMGLNQVDIAEGYVVNYETEEIIYVKGFENDGNTYYKLSETRGLSIEE